MNINQNSITLMNHTITINDMIDNLYYRTDIELAKNEKALKILYINNLDENDKNYFYHLINAKISEESKIANLIKPIFKFIVIENNNDEYFLEIDNSSNNTYIDYKTNNKFNYKINIYQTEDDKYKFNNRDWSWHILSLEPFYSTLKFKIKQEKITKKIRNDFNEYKKTNDKKYYTLANDLIDVKNNINKNNIIFKYYIGIIYLLMFIDFLYIFYNNE